MEGGREGGRERERKRGKASSGEPRGILSHEVFALSFGTQRKGERRGRERGTEGGKKDLRERET